ncbi:DNA-3-methyladenine glycosylase family protein [Agrobacterium rubi]|uniref:DNA-3-methyladenine glycosylase II n=1 Tax=Agrobacterium rubi TaxID=28099 RepID=A0AAE7USG7_9HYPH|nr:DNA-3-methyladenine glycosylase [Agrobacterium rubi]NTE88421.1 DNA-3-methyladenine glycosylase 2 family protein [Agrobacterium rubi]NTF04187.1 DNA-3-methyladenine glycosylase 2 family protein [Agrobacterium rubi]NTF09600.1 DNA-3-methyladenine glycosylase 2 family protein [Agrobacterium rubi]NTF22507.1 DNA-3-methyladenine glycosylase 2 family protein [Agrobacterium rubi]NTF29364.1 DNA-3-methyladenine glycosylase 2 family protein [Agrobacterium rubi]
MVNIIRNAADIEEGLANLLQIDPRLERVALKAGPLPLRLNKPGFAGLAHIIVSQVVSRASADAIWRRMADAVGEITTQNYLAVATVEAPQFGLSRAKARTLHGVATTIAEGRLNLDALNALDEREAFARLTALKGIGPWTAQVYLMFCGGHADIFPSGDVALQAAVAQAFQMDARPSEKELNEIASLWSPWRAVAARLFWAYYASMTLREAVPVA